MANCDGTKLDQGQDLGRGILQYVALTSSTNSFPKKT